MPTISEGSNVTIDLSANDAYLVTVVDAGEAYVDLLAGAPGAPYDTPRVKGQSNGKVFGPYGVPARIRVRAISGACSYSAYAAPQPVKLDPVTGQLIANGSPVSGYGKGRIDAVAFGSSLTELNFVNNPTYGTTRQQDRSWIGHMNFVMGDKFLRVQKSYALGGQRIDQILTQIQAAVLRSEPILIGDFGIINSIAAGHSVARMTADLYACLDAATSAGKVVIALNGTPMGATAANPTPTLAVHQLLAQMNALMLAYAAPRGHIVIPAAEALVDSTNANGFAVAAYLQYGTPVDQLHYAQAGSRIIGAAAALVVGPRLSPNIQLSTSQARVYDATNAPLVLGTNPLFLGTAGTNNAAATCPGNVPTGCTLSAGGGGTITGTSAVAATGVSGGKGNEWTLTVTSVSAIGTLGFLTMEPDFSAKLVAGCTVRASVRVGITGAANLWGVWVYVTAVVDGVTTYFGVEEPSADAAGILIGECSQADMAGVRTVEFEVPSGVVTNVRFVAVPKFAATAATAVIKLSQVSVDRLT